MRALAARVDAVLVQAVIAAALSFAHIHDLAAAAGQGGWKAWAYPVSVDLLLVAAWRRLRSGGPKAAGWCWFLIALAASLGAMTLEVYAEATEEQVREALQRLAGGFGGG